MRTGRLKLHYALVYSVLGAYLPYLPVYLNELGFSDTAIGWVVGVYGLAVLASPVVLTAAADRLASNRVLIGGGFALAALMLGAMTMTQQLAGIVLTFLLFSLGFTALIPLSDGLYFATMRRRREHGATTTPYHRVRIWGSIGFIAPSIVLFGVLGYLDVSTRAAILLAGACAAAGALNSIALPRGSSEQAGRGGSSLPTAQAWRTLSGPRTFAFIGSLFLMFMAIAVFYTFYPRYLQELGIDTRWLGLIVNIGVVVELGFMAGSGWLLRGIGLRGMMLMGALCMVVRLGLLWAVPSVPVALLTQVLHGPIVLSLYVVPPMYLNHKAAPQFRNSIQGLSSLLCYGIARLLGSVLAGYVAVWGLREVFAFGTILSAGAMVWLLAGFRDAPASATLEREHGERGEASLQEG